MVKNKIRIFIEGAHNCYNFGDDAIFIAILYFLEKNLGLTEKNCQIYIYHVGKQMIAKSNKC